MSIDKWAVDESAKSYWSDYYKEYGKSWVRDIPRRIRKAAKQANILDTGIVTPIGTAWDDAGLYLEGVFRQADGNELLFSASFDHDGTVTKFNHVATKPK